MSPRPLAIFFRFLLFCFVSLLTQKSYSQTCIPNFYKTYGGVGSDEGLDVVSTQDGGSIIAGRTTSNGASMDGLLMKLDQQGSLTWTKSYGQDYFDEISKIIQTTDGGFLGVGRTAASASSQGNAWIIRLDPSGVPLWSWQLKSSLGPTSAKDLIQLDDGGFVVALNVNDSTAQGDGVLVRMDGEGTMLWSRSYDNGNNDGFHTITQDGSFLVAAGYTISNTRDGFVLKVNASDGAIVWSKKLSSSYPANDVVRVDVTPKGYMIALVGKKVVDLNFPANYAHLYIVRLENETVINYINRYNLDAGSPYTVGSVALKFAGDSAFIFTVSDTLPSRSSVYRRMIIDGFSTGFGRKVDGFHTVNSLEGIDSYDGKGLVLAGTIRDWNTRNKIQVVKTDWQGSFGSCTGTAFGVSTDTVKYLSVTPFTSVNTKEAAVSASAVAAGGTPITFSESVVCQKQDCVPASAVNGTECNATLLAEYWNKYQLLAVEALRVPDGYIMCGSNRTTLQPVVIKVGFNGKVLWSKSINSSHHSAAFEHIRLMDDGNILLAGRGGYVIDHDGYTISVFVKMSSEGEVLWAKYVRGFLVDLKPTGDGTFTILHYPDDASWGSIAKVIIDPAGNLTYKKRLNKSSEIIPMHRRIALDGNQMYAAGEAWNSVVIEKFDSSGLRNWTKRIVDDNNQTTRVEGIYLVGDSLYVTARVSTQVGWTYKENIMLVKVGKDGNGINSVLIQQDFVNDYLPFFIANNMRVFHTAMTSDGNFVLADCISGSPDSSIALIKFSPAGKILWAKKYAGLKQHIVMSVQDDGIGLTIVGLQLYSYNNNGDRQYNPLLIHTDNNGDLVSGSGAICNATPFATAIAPNSLLQDFIYNPPTPNSEWLDFDEHWYQTDERLLETVATFACGIKANCSMVHLAGATKICNNGDIQVYQVERNEGCIVPIAWRFDTTFVQVVASTDTSLSVRFKRAGYTKMYASIQTPCENYIDSLQVNVLLLANTVNLGPDTTICPGNTIVVNARKGYDSYQWQDGSTDSSFSASKPGLYYVTVHDLCGGSFTDSIRINPNAPIPFNVSPDRSKCNSDTLHLKAPDGFLNYSWSNVDNLSSLNAQEVIVTPLVDTAYYVRAEKTPGCFAYDTVRIHVNTSPPINLGADTSFCSGDSAVFDAGTAFSNYVWSNGANTRKIAAKTEGVFSVIGTTEEGCKSYDTVKVLNVFTNPVVNLGQNPVLCTGSSRTLDAGSYSSFLWNDGSASQTITVKDVGVYAVEVTDNNGCKGMDSTTITTLLPLPAKFLPSDTLICSYDKLTLPSRNQYKSYLWSTGASAPSITISQPGMYWLEVRDAEGCVGRDSVVVNPKDCMEGFYIPTAFTPNHDGKNDVFRPLLFGNVKKYQFTIYNRWGQVVFQTPDQMKSWDGKVAGHAQDSNVFVWTCTYQLEGQDVKTERGTVVLIR